MIATTLLFILVSWLVLCLLLPRFGAFVLMVIAVILAIPIIVVLFPFYIILIGCKHRNDRTTGFL